MPTGEDWRGRVAVALAVLLPITVAAVIWILAAADDDLTERGATVLAALMGGLVGALGTYLGFHRKSNGTSPPPGG